MVIVERLLIVILCIAVFRAHRKINDLTLFGGKIMNLTEIVILADTLVIVIMAGIGIFTSKQLDNRVRRIRELQVLLDEYSDMNLELAKRINDKNNENEKLRKQVEGQKEVINMVATNQVKMVKKGEQ